MRFTFVAVLATVLLVSVAAVPLIGEREDSSGSQTFSALKNLFEPIFSWFRVQLPSKTPSELGNDMKETVRDVREWADSNSFVQGAKEAVQPVHQWFKDTGNALRDKTFREMFYDTKEAATSVDQQIGDWINKVQY